MKNANPVLVSHQRGGITESFHRGVICVVDEHGEVIASEGDIQQVCYPRSALKYFQHIPLITSGAYDYFGFDLKDLALMCGSHNGEDIHTEGALRILNKIGLGPEALGCGAQQPTHKKDYIRLIQAQQEPTALHNNCSGKHSGFLAYCKFMNLSTDDYLDLNHPLHKEVRRIAALMHELSEEQLIPGLDGCSAPIFAMPVYNQALAYKNLIRPAKFGSDITRACNLITQAIAAHPEMIAGSKRYCTDLIRETGGRILGKTGADGVYCIAVPEKGWGICIKIDDGRMGPQYNVTQGVLESLGLVNKKEAVNLRSYLKTENKNYAGNFTGYTVVSETVTGLKTH